LSLARHAYGVSDEEFPCGHPGVGDPVPREQRPTASFEGSEGLALVHADELDDQPPDATVAGVVLAAGTSSRFDGANKLLADLDGQPIVRHAVRSLEAAAVDFDPLVVVVGHEAAAVRAALGDADVAVVENPDYAAGQATSMRAGLEAAGDADAALFALGDMPFVLPRTVEGLVRAYRAGVGEALAAAYAGDRGNPVLFGRPHFEALADVEGDTGGRAVLLDSEDGALVETGDPGVLVDVDDPGDLETFR
jgi:molybdenum cofactor cytidylyltransferase